MLPRPAQRTIDNTMNYIELKCSVQPLEKGSEILAALLGEIGYESFMDWEEGIYAYIPEGNFSEDALKKLYIPDSGIRWNYKVNRIEDKDWNAAWESDFEPVWIEGRCYVHSSFHEKAENAEFDIVVDPEMSFGTAHHETTCLMIGKILKEDCNNKSVLDIGSGTGILAILSEKKGAKDITAIDNDEWAYKNTIKNCVLNKCERVHCILCNAESIPDKSFDIIFANINRNTLLNDMKHYVKHLCKKGTLLVSGFYKGNDLECIKKTSSNFGLKFEDSSEMNDWVVAKFIR